MTTRTNNKTNELSSILQISLGWHKSRTNFLSAFILALIKTQSISFLRLAEAFEGNILIESKLRRIQRFFADFIFNPDTIARLIFNLIPQNKKHCLVMDRTNWKFGKTHLNILMLGIAWHGVAIPLLWRMLPNAGNSNYKQRKEIMDKYIKLFGINTIDRLLADREFIGSEWFEYLSMNGIQFNIRLRNNTNIYVVNKGNKKVKHYFAHKAFNSPFYMKKPVSLQGNLVYLSGIKIMAKEGKTEYVILASPCLDYQALENYRQRWQIETMFKALKSSGFNIEDTHLSSLERFSKLLSLVSIAFVWAYLLGIYKHKQCKAIKIKKHGYKAFSYFKYGLIFISEILLSSCKSKRYKDILLFLSCS